MESFESHYEAGGGHILVISESHCSRESAHFDAVPTAAFSISFQPESCKFMIKGSRINYGKSGEVGRGERSFAFYTSHSACFSITLNCIQTLLLPKFVLS